MKKERRKERKERKRKKKRSAGRGPREQVVESDEAGHVPDHVRVAKT